MRPIPARFGEQVFACLSLCFLLVTGVRPCWAVEPYQPNFGDPLLEPWRWRTFPELSGLNAQCIDEDADGTMWFGTNEGLWSFDGITWSYHDRDGGVSGGVSTLCLGADGSLYAAGNWGISCRRDGRWSGVFPGSGQRAASIRKLALGRDGALWAATSWGALCLRDARWSLFTDAATAARIRADANAPVMDIELLPAAVVTKSRPGAGAGERQNLADVCVDVQGRIWFATEAGEVLCRLADGDGDWKIYNEEDGMICGRRPSLLARRDGTIWVTYGAASDHLNTFDGNGWKTIDLVATGLPGEGGNLLETSDGVAWLSGRYVLCAYRDGQWRVYQKPEVPIPTAVNFVLQSTDGALWIGGPSTEIHRVDYQTPRWLTLQDLNFHWESPAGVQWFLHREGRVVEHAAGQWTSHGVADGVIDTPVVLLGTRRGEVWVAGSHGAEAAVARFDGTTWTRIVLDDFSWGVEWRGAIEAADGSLWFSAAVDTSGPRAHRAGLLQFRDGRWIHHHQPGRSRAGGTDDDPATLLPATQRPEPIGKFLCLGESRDGKIWAGRNILIWGDGKQWSVFSPPPEVRPGIIETTFTSREGEFWIGTRQFGALRYDGREWRQFQGSQSLVANSVRAIAQTADGSIWAATDRGFSRFDGHSWSSDLLPAPLAIAHEGGSLKSSPNDDLWINHFTPDWNRRAWSKAARIDTATCEFRTVRHQFRGIPPDTTITVGAQEVSHPGNLSVLWSGAAPWRAADDSRLQFSFRLDGGAWSPFDPAPGHAFFALPAGHHRLEVRSRDDDFNVDPTPAVLEFAVLPPVWRQGWFVALLVLLGAVIITQSVRVIRERGRLRQANRELASEVQERARADEALRQLNAELDRRVKDRTRQLEVANKELEAFSYSVSHDLRGPLRGIDGFSQALLEDYGAKLDDEGLHYLRRVRASAQRMGRLIDDMLSLSRVTRGEMRRERVDLSGLVREIADDLAGRERERQVTFTIAPDLFVSGDPRFLRVALENLLGNAWKFTAKRADAAIAFGATEHDGRPVFYVRDNGAGFDMEYAGRLFEAFQRLHSDDEFPGTGIGLAIVQRIIHRHGGRVWAEGRVNEGATIFFEVPAAELIA